MLYISITGKGKLIKDKDVLKEHWLNELNKWFDQEIDTPEIIMITPFKAFAAPEWVSGLNWYPE